MSITSNTQSKVSVFSYRSSAMNSFRSVAVTTFGTPCCFHARTSSGDRAEVSSLIVVSSEFNVVEDLLETEVPILSVPFHSFHFESIIQILYILDTCTLAVFLRSPARVLDTNI